MNLVPAVWLPTVRANSGADVFTVRLRQALEAKSIRAEIAWLPLRAEYAPWTVAKPQPPPWANIVHVNTWLPRRFIPPNLPVVATLHSCVHDRALEPYKSRLQALYHRHWIRPLESATLRRATVVTAVSRYTATSAEQLFGRDDIVVIPNSVDTQIYSPVERAVPNDPFRLLYVGNWSRLKGVDLLGPIMQELGDDFELLYTEDRALRHNQYALPPNCRSIGRPHGAPAMANSFRDADALIFPTRREGFGLVAAEAQACGLPVISVAGSSLPEVVAHEHSGILCTPDAVDQFVDAARRLREDGQLWRAMRRNAREHSLQAFSEDKTVEGYVAAYRTALSAQRGH